MMNQPLLNINSKEVHIWLVNPLQISDKKLLQTYYDILNDEEMQRLKKFKFDHLKNSFLITRVLIRFVLSRYIYKKPESWKFQENKYGKPQIYIPQKNPPLQFNISHTDGLICCAITKNNAIGIDTENINRDNINLKIADSYFSGIEANELKKFHESEKKERFFTYWTLKEAYIKAKGKGLSIPLNIFSFHIRKDKPVTISFDPYFNDNPASWQFVRFQPEKTHIVSVAVSKSDMYNYNFTTRNVIPLKEEKIIHPVLF